MQKKELEYIFYTTMDLIGVKPGKDACSLVLGTGAAESHLGKYMRQINFSMESNKGAYGLYGMELLSDADLWINYLEYKPFLHQRVQLIVGSLNHKDALIGNLYYQTAMCRLQYARFKEPLPAVDDIEGQGRYYKKYYNTHKGKGSVEKYVEDYRHFLLN